MNFHSTTASRISKMDGTTTVEHRATLHYVYTNRAVILDNTATLDLGLDKNVEVIK